MDKNTCFPAKPDCIDGGFTYSPVPMSKRLSKKKIILLGLAAFLFCLCNTAYPEIKSSEHCIARIDFSSWIESTLTVSPDNTRVAYAAQEGKKQFLVVDGKPGTPYDRIVISTFSPDSAKVACVAETGKQQLVVMDGEEGNRYDELVKGKRVIFDSPDSLHYLALKIRAFI